MSLEHGKTWRYIYHPPAVGSWNMAVDEALFETAIKNHEPPTLRVFSWDPACLSIGYAQSITDVDFDLLNQYGFTFVRRPTGGRAILHVDELTYSITAPVDDPIMAGGILPSYQRISSALLAFLQNLGLSAEANEKASALPLQKAEAICFEVPSNYEITIHGKKIIGSAQARRKSGVLQHGSIPLFGDIGRISDVLSYPTKAERETARSRVLQRATTVEHEIHQSVSLPAAAEIFRKSFESSLNIDLINSQLSTDEYQLAKDLQKSKYAHPDWNGRI